MSKKTADRTEGSVDILVIEDDANTALSLKRVLEREGYSVVCAHSLSEAMQTATEQVPRIVLLDLSLPDGDGVECIEELKTHGVRDVIVVSGTDDAEKTRNCLQAGVFDFILKPASASDVVRSIRRSDGLGRQRQVVSGEYPIPLSLGFGSLEGSSAASVKLTNCIKQAAAQKLPSALLIGQPGVLKADIAALLHHYTGRPGSALLVNCASENDDGAPLRFFGGREDTAIGTNEEPSPGYFHKANGATLVLDDISSLDVSLQRRLATYLKEGEVYPLNSLTPVRHDCALVCILREPANQALESGRLDESLYFAMAGTTIVVPPLVERQQDIVFFARQAVTQLNRLFGTEKSLSEGMLEQLKGYYWPGNLVELKNCLLAAYRRTEAGDEIKPDSSLFTSLDEMANDKITPFVGQSFQAVEKLLIEATLADNNGNKSRTAQVLGISLKTLYNRLNSYEEAKESELAVS